MNSITFTDDYAAQAKQYAVFPRERSIEYTALGLASEVGELIAVLLHSDGDVDMGLDSEAGDCWWYAAALADALDTPFSEVAGMRRGGITKDRDLLVEHLAFETGAIAGAVKKMIRDDGGALTRDRKGRILDHLHSVCLALDDLALWNNTASAGVMSRNLNKLEDRKRRNVIQGDGDHR
jgi:NTP pyrophosphatase (non-canonical NTP hydrolase)